MNAFFTLAYNIYIYIYIQISCRVKHIDEWSKPLLETSNFPQTKEWFTPFTYVVYSTRNLNTYIYISLETSNLPQTKKWFTPLTYVVHSARNLNTYIHTYLNWKQVTYHKQKSGLL